jgi:hypothetical protein
VFLLVFAGAVNAAWVLFRIWAVCCLVEALV